ncbi:MAG: hypothetical protein HS108_16215 [Planctomycetes bacterium]|jgi:hypothetical protein|nr:hypothetical protein [Planctomycetota bacterium]
MSKILKLGLYVFALLGLVVTAFSGYVYATNKELASQFWEVRGDLKLVPDERRKEVVGELPARITFEREVREDMGALPDDRQKELYEQLASSRDQVFKQFKERIKAEAEIARKAKDAQEATKKIEEALGKVSVGIDLKGGSSKPVAPRVDNLAAVEKSRAEVIRARANYGAAKDTRDSGKITDAAIRILEALDKLGTEVQAARKKSLASDEKERLSDIVQDAKATLYDTKQTPGLAENARAKPLLESIPRKLNE